MTFIFSRNRVSLYWRPFWDFLWSFDINKCPAYVVLSLLLQIDVKHLSKKIRLWLISSSISYDVSSWRQGTTGKLLVIQYCDKLNCNTNSMRFFLPLLQTTSQTGSMCQIPPPHPTLKISYLYCQPRLVSVQFKMAVS